MCYDRLQLDESKSEEWQSPDRISGRLRSDYESITERNTIANHAFLLTDSAEVTSIENAVSFQHAREANVKTPLVSVLLFLIASLLGALGQFLYKSGADSAGKSLSSYLLNVRILGGVFCYTAVMVLFVAAFRKGGALSVLYPVYATTFIWAAIIGLIAYQTPIKLIHLCGMAFLLLGMYLMGK